MKINILGQEYQIEIDKTKNNPKLEDANGYIELYSKKIILDDVIEDKYTFENLVEFKKKVLRHEIVHAFFHESGLHKYCDDEMLVDFLALQIYKMSNAFNQAESIVYGDK